MTTKYTRQIRGWTVVIEQTDIRNAPRAQNLPKKLFQRAQKALEYEGHGRAYPEQKKIEIAIPFTGNALLVLCVACHELGHIADKLETRTSIRIFAPLNEYLPPRTAKRTKEKLAGEEAACEHGKRFFHMLAPELVDFYDALSRRVMIMKIAINGKEPADVIEWIEKNNPFKHENGGSIKLPRKDTLAADSLSRLINFMFRQIDATLANK